MSRSSRTLKVTHLSSSLSRLHYGGTHHHQLAHLGIYLVDLSVAGSGEILVLEHALDLGDATLGHVYHGRGALLVLAARALLGEAHLAQCGLVCGHGGIVCGLGLVTLLL